ncbi:PQQ-binding-like beta-propeller repeat protein [Saccharopolyspora phatthalungensis]|uniref:Uncharacterized protein n=1 Tax=Saccharopolyspora phatthalungensis TaxID=664693 RepID=A0A840QAK6_9PSEU|nr:PQQ-binding-like beta-propeller repeat protein [Saccharopolyspora phatthalungensis]MBB5159572.1 hypothetical protein [Saccharopolyspora phatthalungensis]
MQQYHPGQIQSAGPGARRPGTEGEGGEERWSLSIGHSIWSSPVVADGVVYVGSDDSNLYAVFV